MTCQCRASDVRVRACPASPEGTDETNQTRAQLAAVETELTCLKMGARSGGGTRGRASGREQDAWRRVAEKLQRLRPQKRSASTSPKTQLHGGTSVAVERPLSENEPERGPTV